MSYVTRFVPSQKGPPMPARPYICPECDQPRAHRARRGPLPRVCPQCRGRPAAAPSAVLQPQHAPAGAELPPPADGPVVTSLRAELAELGQPGAVALAYAAILDNADAPFRFRLAAAKEL